METQVTKQPPKTYTRKPFVASDPRPTDSVTYAFVENINRILGHEWGINAKVATYCGVSQAQIGRWRSGASVPKIDMMYKLSEFARVPIMDFLVKKRGRKPRPKTSVAPPHKYW